MTLPKSHPLRAHRWHLMTASPVLGLLAESDIVPGCGQSSVFFHTRGY